MWYKLKQRYAKIANKLNAEYQPQVSRWRVFHRYTLQFVIMRQAYKRYKVWHVNLFKLKQLVYKLDNTIRSA